MAVEQLSLLLDNLGNHPSWILIRESFVESVTVIHQVPVIRSQQVKHRCMKVVHADPVLNGLMPNFIGGAVNHPFPDSSSSHPDAKSARAMVSPCGTRIISNLR